MKKFFEVLQLAVVRLSAIVPAIMQNQTSICCLSHQRPPQKIELVISCQP